MVTVLLPCIDAEYRRRNLGKLEVLQTFALAAAYYFRASPKGSKEIDGLVSRIEEAAKEELPVSSNKIFVLWAETASWLSRIDEEEKYTQFYWAAAQFKLREILAHEHYRN